MRLVIARCSVDYAGRLTAHLPSAPRLILVKADGSVSIHADDRAYKPLNWMSPPCSLKEGTGDEEGVWTVVNKAGEKLIITMEEILHDSSHELGVDPGLIKDGVEAHLQELLADRIETLGEGYTLIRREYMTAIGPVDILCRDGEGQTVAVEIKRRGEIDGATCTVPAARHWAVEVKRRAGIDAVEQLTRYLEFLNRDSTLAPVGGILAAQAIAPQARTLAEDRGIRCVILDYDALRGIKRDEMTLF
ncbi:endonuclease NucS [Streptomyces sp. BBFR109]|uniref:endonuclease NucS n=1 Tax=Streptomyces sp. BBFR109 TaxID=3448172 RepID=UPI003F776D56